MKMSSELICIVGPTAVGKTRLSIEIAKALGGEIINGDAMQIYRGLDIGTAKITPAEMNGIPHYLINEKNPDETYSVAEFQTIVREKIEEVKARKRLPILVGGTGLYVKSVLYDYEFSGPPGDGQSKTTSNENDALTNEELHAKLMVVDPEEAKNVHPNNRKRVIRALEIFETSGVKKSVAIAKQDRKLLYDVKLIGLTDEREVLYARINARVDAMLESGLIDEVRKLYKLGIPKEAQAMQAIGYKELYGNFAGETSLEVAIELIKRNSRRLAKRQYTWFRNQMDVTWFDVDVDNFGQTIAEVRKWLGETSDVSTTNPNLKSSHLWG